jgi:CHASE2 domain-containing sensor protein
VNSLGIEEGLLPPFMKSALKGKLVILGAMVSGSDWHRVPMTVATGIEVSGADIHAQMLAQLLDGRRIEKAPLYFSTMLVFVTAFLLYLALETLGERHPEIIFEFLVIAAAIIFGTIMFSRYKLNFPSAELGLAWLLVALTAKYTTKLAVKFQK